MGANRGAIDAVVTAVRHDLGQRDRYGLPDPGIAPAPKPPVNRVPVAVFGRDIAPRRAATEPPEYPVNDRPVRFGPPTSPPVRCINRQQTPQNTPFRFAQIASAQACLQKAALNQPRSFASTNLSTPPSSTNTPIPQFWNGTSWVGVTGGKDDLAGEYVCKFGRTTSQTCGYIDPYEYYDSTFKGYFPRVNRGSGPQLNIEGDSGGAVYQGSLAVGFVHGRDSTYNMYYTPLRNLVQNSVGIAILTIYP